MCGGSEHTCLVASHWVASNCPDWDSPTPTTSLGRNSRDKRQDPSTGVTGNHRERHKGGRKGLVTQTLRTTLLTGCSARFLAQGQRAGSPGSLSSGSAVWPLHGGSLGLPASPEPSSHVRKRHESRGHGTRAGRYHGDQCQLPSAPQKLLNLLFVLRNKKPFSYPPMAG